MGLSFSFTSRRPPEHVTAHGHDLPEIMHTAVSATGPADSRLAVACADRVTDLLDHATYTTPTGTRPVVATDIAVVVSHVTQAATVRAFLAGHPDTLVGTANQLQGLERPISVVLHPLAGYRDLSAFTLDTGRACVMLSRHRAHLSVVTDTTTPAVLAATDPGTIHHQLTGHITATPTW